MSAVLGEIMLVAIVIVLAVVLYLMVSSPSAPPTSGLSLLLDQKTNTQNATNASRNDTVLEVTGHLGSGDLFWNDSTLQATIANGNGTLLSGHSLEFNDTIRDGKAGAGDRIVIRGMTNAYHRATLVVVYQGSVVYQGQLD